MNRAARCLKTVLVRLPVHQPLAFNATDRGEPNEVPQGLLGVAVHLAAHLRVNRPVVDRITERLETLLDRSGPPFSSRFAASLDRRT